MSDRWLSALVLGLVLGVAAGFALGRSSRAASPPPLEPVTTWRPVETGTPQPAGSTTAEPTGVPSPAVPLEPTAPAVSTPAPTPTKAPVRLQSPVRTPTPVAVGTGWRQAVASFYGPGFYGRRTACGQAYTTAIVGVAHRTLRCGTLIDFRYDGRVLLRVPVIDRGPYVAGRLWDLSGAACTALRHCFTGGLEWRYSA